MTTPTRLTSFAALPGPLRALILRHPTTCLSSRPLTSSHPSLRTYATYNPNINANANANAAPSSVNDAEVSHFNALASSWWDPHGSSRLLHLMNPLRHKFLHQCLDTHITTASTTTTTTTAAAAAHEDGPPKLRLLDIGCGGGIFAESAARSRRIGAVTAIDPTPEVIAVARRHQRTDPQLLAPGRLTYRNVAVEALPLPATPAAGYDVISLFEVIEHVRDPAAFLRAVLPHLRPGGWLVGSTIARSAAAWLTTKLVAEDLLRIVPRGTHDWAQYIQPHELRDWAALQDELDVGPGGVGWKVQGVVYVPGVGWKEVSGSEDWGNYFFGVRKKDTE